MSVGQPKIPIDRQALGAFCRRWKISELALFGSVVRDDFRPESDVDMLVVFEPGSTWSLLDHANMESELASILGRRVDLVSRRAVERSRNPYRRKSILESAVPLHVA